MNSITVELSIVVMYYMDDVIGVELGLDVAVAHKLSLDDVVGVELDLEAAEAHKLGLDVCCMGRAWPGSGRSAQARLEQCSRGRA